MNSIDIRRLAEIERMLDQVSHRPEVEPFRDPYTMTDAEAVEEWHRLCHIEPPRHPWPKLAEEAVAVAWFRSFLDDHC